MVATKRLSLQDADSLLKAMLVFSRTVDQVLENRIIGEFGEPLSKSKLQILRLLGQRGAQSSTRIARFLGTSKPAVTQIIDAMVENRLVSRARSPHDRRGVILRLTARGQKFFAKVRHEQRHLIRNAIRLTGGEGRERWTKVLEQMATALARADRTFQHYCLQCGAHADGSCVLVGGDAHCLFLENRGKAASGRRSRPSKV